MNITEIEGIGPDNGQKLADAGITTTEQLLERGATSSGRNAIEAATGISDKLILEWVNHADLMRLDGVGAEYADLLEAAGVDSPAELARRNPANLAQTFQEVVAARPDTVRRIPSEETVTGWIEQAKSLGKAVSHGGAAPAGEAPAPVAAAHDHDHDHGHDHAAASAPAPAPKPAPVATPAPATKAPTAAAAPAKAESGGLMARIKRLFGG